MALRAVYGVGDDADGEMVYLVRTRMDGSVEHDWMPASVAVAEVGYHEGEWRLPGRTRLWRMTSIWEPGTDRDDG